MNLAISHADIEKDFLIPACYMSFLHKVTCCISHTNYKISMVGCK